MKLEDKLDQCMILKKLGIKIFEVSKYKSITFSVKTRNGNPQVKIWHIKSFREKYCGTCDLCYHRTVNEIQYGIGNGDERGQKDIK